LYMDLNGTMLHIMIHFSILFRNHATRRNTTHWCLNVSYFHSVIHYTSNIYSFHYLWHFYQCVDGADDVRDDDAAEMDKRKVSLQGRDLLPLLGYSIQCLTIYFVSSLSRLLCYGWCCDSLTD
jgi:hypothetical protein